MTGLPEALGAGSSTDRDALMAFYRSTGGSGWSKSDSWGTDPLLSDWWGVEVDGGRRVVSLSVVAANDLTGAIPCDLGQLANLEFLSLGSNDLTGHDSFRTGRLGRADVAVSPQQRPDGCGSRRIGRPRRALREMPTKGDF